MDLTTQYSFAGDYTGKSMLVARVITTNTYVVEALTKAVTDVAKFDAGTSVFYFLTPYTGL